MTSLLHPVIALYHPIRTLRSKASEASIGAKTCYEALVKGEQLW